MLLASLAPGCAPEPTPRWIRLHGKDSEFRAPSDCAMRLTSGRGLLTIEPEGTRRTLGTTLAAEDWELDPQGGWRAKLDFSPLSLLTSLGAPSLTSEQRTFDWVQTDPRSDSPEAPGPGEFQVRGRWIELGLAPGRVPPEALRFGFSLPAIGEQGGVHGSSFSGRGSPLLPGEERSWQVDFPPGSSLRFFLAIEPWDGAVHHGDAGQGSKRAFSCEVRLEGALLHQRNGDEELDGWQAVPLPAEGGSGELTFAFEGPPATALILDPVIAPSDVGRPGERPWPETRPDIVLFLADTLRADALAAYGGPPYLTPGLNAFAADSVRYARAWSVGTFTLAAHASLFTGLLPRQAGISSEISALPGELETIAERLSAHGYRTGAITDAGFVSHAYGMQQGFATFDERRETLESTLERARAFLAADDGRPIFLFVHTYQAHAPFTVSAETRQRLGKVLGVEGDHETILASIRALAHEEGLDGERLDDPARAAFLARPEVEAQLRKLEALYRGGVADLDRGFARFLEELERHGVLANGYVVFTSDHGEAFGEHGDVHHSGKVYGEQTRVPLLIHGGDLAPRRVKENVSLVDVAPTLAELARIPVPASWVSRSLLAPYEERRPEDRVVFCFECDDSDEGSTLAVIAEDRKVIGYEDPAALRAGRILGAYDLHDDPGELRDLQAEEPFGPELLRLHRSALERALVPAFDPALAEVGQKLQEMRALGYLGD